MKKTFMIALAGLMLFAFTQCGDGGNSKKDGKAKTEKTSNNDDDDDFEDDEDDDEDDDY